MLVGNRTAGNMLNKILEYNRIAERCDFSNCVESFVSSLNSYLGFLKHYSSYNIRAEAMKKISTKWWKFCRYTSGVGKIVCKVKGNSLDYSLI